MIAFSIRPEMAGKTCVVCDPVVVDRVLWLCFVRGRLSTSLEVALRFEARLVYFLVLRKFSEAPSQKGRERKLAKIDSIHV